MTATLSPPAMLASVSDLPMIADLERIANQGAAREKFVLDEARKQAHVEIFGPFYEGFGRSMTAAAGFFEACKTNIDGFVRFDHLRVGMVAMDGFKILAILPAFWNPRAREFRRIARMVETFYRDSHDHDVHILTMCSDSPDLERIGGDFPFLFSPEANA